MTTTRPSGQPDGAQSPTRDLYRAAFADPADRDVRRQRPRPSPEPARQGAARATGLLARGQDPGRRATAAALASLPSRLAVAAGAWLLVAPFALSYSTAGAGFGAYWNDVLVGIAVIAVSAPQIAAPRRSSALPSAGAVLGGWLAVAPFVLGYADSGAPHAVTNDVLVGALVVLLSLLGRLLGGRPPSR